MFNIKSLNASVCVCISHTYASDQEGQKRASEYQFLGAGAAGARKLLWMPELLSSDPLEG